jgi:uncharacterized membrane protein/protein-disulfide isomerase
MVDLGEDYQMNTKQVDPATPKTSSFVGKGPILVLLGLSIVGIFASGFLSYRHILLAGHQSVIGESFLCRASGSVNCDAILETDNAFVLDFLPASILGLAGFTFACWLLLNSLLFPRLRKTSFAALALYFVSSLGFSGYFSYIMAFKADYICTWCIAVHVINLISTAIVLGCIIKSRAMLDLEDKSSLLERIYLVIGGVAVSAAVLTTATLWEKDVSSKYYSAKCDEFLYDPQVLSTVIRKSPKYEIPVSENDPFYGNMSAKYQLVMFTDFQCVECALAEVFIKKIVDLNSETICLVFKNYPLSNDCNKNIVNNLHPMACQAAQAAYSCFLLGGNSAFLRFSEMIFPHRRSLNNSLFEETASSINLDMESFKSLMKPLSRSDQKVLDDVRLGVSLGLDSTPQFFFLGRKIPDSAKGELLVHVLEELIKGEECAEKPFNLRLK